MEVFRVFGSVLLKGHDDAGRALDSLDKKAGGLGQKLGQMGGSVSAVGGTMTKWVTGPLLGAGAGLLALTNKAAGVGDELAKTATKLGVSTDALQEMEYWASQNGISSDAMERAVGRLNQRVGRAAMGNDKYAEAFSALNVEIVDANGNVRDTEDVMQDTIAALRDIEDPALRSAMASEIFGTKMARDLMPALEDSSLSLEDAAKKAHELGIVMGEDSIESSEDYMDAMDDLNRSLGALWRGIGEKLIPVLVNDVIPIIQDKVVPAIGAFADRIIGLIEWFMELDPVWQKVIGYAVAFFVAIGPILLVVGKFISILGVVIPVVAKVGAIIAAVAAGPFALIVAAIAAVIAIGYLLWRNWDAIVEFARNLWQMFSEWFMTLWETVRDAVVGFAQGLWDGVKEWFQSLIDWATGAWEAYWDFYRNLWETIRDAVLGFAQDIWDGIKGRFQAVIDWATGAWEGFRDSIKRVWDRITGIIDGARRAILGIIDRIIGPIRDAIEWVQRLLGQADEAHAYEPPTAGTPEHTAGRHRHIPELGEGGHVRKPGWALVGEEGPELMHLGRGATVAPLSEVGGTQRLEIAVDVRGDARLDTRAIEQATIRVLESRLPRMIRSGDRAQVVKPALGVRRAMT